MEEMEKIKKSLSAIFIITIIACITVAEYVFAYMDVSYGILLALLITLTIYIVVSVTIKKVSRSLVDCAESLALIPLYILFTSSLPWFFIDQQLLLPAVYSTILALCFWHVYYKGISLTEIGFRKENMLRYLLLGLCLGIPLGSMEYFIIMPAPAFPTFEFKYMLRDLFYMVFFVGLAEELLFRGLVQRDLTNMFSARWGLLGASFLFMVMHLTWRSVPELGFTFLAGMILGYIYQKTNSLVAPIFLHGVANTMLVAVLPYLW